MPRNIKVWIFIIILSFFANKGYSCVCPPLTKESAKNLILEFDFVFVGSPVSSVNFNIWSGERFLARNDGSDIIFKIIKSIKGNLKNETEVFINQFLEGNCYREFTIGGEYLIYGKFFTYYQKSNPNNPMDPLVRNPQNNYLIDQIGVLYFNDDAFDSVVFYNSLLFEYPGISSNYCMTFDINSKFYTESFN